jgi:plasmid stability protein
MPDVRRLQGRRIVELVLDCYHIRYHRLHGVIAVAALHIRNIDETVKRRLQVRAARHGRSMEAEARAILAEAVSEPADSAGLFTTLLDRFGALGGVDLDLPAREERARAADFSA